MFQNWRNENRSTLNEIYEKFTLKQVSNLKFIIKQGILEIKISKLSIHLMKLKKNMKQTSGKQKEDKGWNWWMRKWKQYTGDSTEEFW